jgi:hypothetical protein
MGLTACIMSYRADTWVGLVSHLVLHDRALGVEGEDIILQAYTEYLTGQDKLGLIP